MKIKRDSRAGVSIASSCSRTASTKQKDQAPPFARILVPVDFCRQSRKAVEYAAALARPLSAFITLIHVVEPTVCQADYGYGPVNQNVPDSQEIKSKRSKLKRLGEKVIGSSALSESIVLSGTPFFEITEAARALNTDLIIIGGHAAGSPDSQLGSTVENVVRHAPCPVFVLSGERTSFSIPVSQGGGKSKRRWFFNNKCGVPGGRVCRH